LYHYFFRRRDESSSRTIFRENWGLLVQRIGAVEESGESARDQLRHVAAIVLRTWRHEPDVVRVLVREIARSPEVQERISDLVKPIEAIRRIIERGQASGEFRADLKPGPRRRRVLRRHRRGADRLGARPAAERDAEVEAAEHTVIEVLGAVSRRR